MFKLFLLALTPSGSPPDWLTYIADFASIGGLLVTLYFLKVSSDIYKKIRFRLNLPILKSKLPASQINLTVAIRRSDKHFVDQELQLLRSRLGALKDCGRRDLQKQVNSTIREIVRLLKNSHVDITAANRVASEISYYVGELEHLEVAAKIGDLTV